MSPQQIKNKIEALEFWLISNPNHPDYSKILADKKALEIQLLTDTKHE